MIFNTLYWARAPNNELYANAEQRRDPWKGLLFLSDISVWPVRIILCLWITRSLNKTSFSVPKTDPQIASSYVIDLESRNIA